MIRDMDLIRELMLKLESMPLQIGAAYLFNFEDFDAGGDLNVDGFNRDQIDYHLNLILEAGFISGDKAASGVVYNSITWEGHDFLDSVRDPVIWDKTKKGAKAAGGFTVELLKDIAKGFIKKQIEVKTGIAL